MLARPSGSGALARSCARLTLNILFEEDVPADFTTTRQFLAAVTYQYQELLTGNRYDNEACIDQFAQVFLAALAAFPHGSLNLQTLCQRQRAKVQTVHAKRTSVRKTNAKNLDSF